MIIGNRSLIVRNPFFSINPQYKDTKFSEFYHQSLHMKHHGKWDWDLELKPIKGLPIYAGWVSLLESTTASITNKHIPIPTLLLATDKSSVPSSAWSDNYLVSDLLVNVENLLPIVPKLGKTVELHVVKNGMHDILHSQEEVVREEAFSKIFTWFGAL